MWICTYKHVCIHGICISTCLSGWMYLCCINIFVYTFIQAYSSSYPYIYTHKYIYVRISKYRDTYTDHNNNSGRYTFPLFSLWGHDSFFTLHPDKAPPCAGPLPPPAEWLRRLPPPAPEEVRSDVKALLIQLFLACCRSLASIAFWCSSSCRQTKGLNSRNWMKWYSWRRASHAHLDLALGLHHLQFGLSQLLLQLPDLSFEGFILLLAALRRHFSPDALAGMRLYPPLALKRWVFCVRCAHVWICHESALGAKPHGALRGGEEKQENWSLSCCPPSRRMLIFDSHWRCNV